MAARETTPRQAPSTEDAGADYLYAGSDLKLAASESHLSSSDNNACRGVMNIGSVLVDVLRYRNRTTEPVGITLTRASGTTPGSVEQVAVAYAGNGANRDWCLSTVFEHHEVTETRSIGSHVAAVDALRAVAGEVNIVFLEGIPDTDLGQKFGCPVELPTWVRQRLRIRGSWRAQLEELRRGTRQEIARQLRKNQYECRLTRDDADFNKFYEQFYRPHILRRHGPSALLVDRERFLRECRRGVVLRLCWQQEAIAGAVLRRIGNTMAVLWTGSVEGGATELRGVTDVLDYFSLLYASLKGCQWLDLGRSRPNLHDGLLRYKRKWGAELTAGMVPQSGVRFGCTGLHPCEQEFLRRNAFIRRHGRRFSALLFVDGLTASNDLHQLIGNIATPGLREYRVIAFSPVGAPLRKAALESQWPVTLIEVGGTQEALAAANG